MPGGQSENLFPITNRSVAGGVNTSVFALDIADDEAQELQNIDASIPGQRVKRKGYTVTATGITFGPILALAEFPPGTGSARLLAVSPGLTNIDHAHLWGWDGTSGMWSAIGPLTGFTGGTARDWEIVVGFSMSSTGVGITQYAVISHDVGNGVNRWLYDGTSLSLADYGGSTAVVSVFAFEQERLLGIGSGLRKNLLFYSNAAAITTFPDPNLNHWRFGGSARQVIVTVAMFRGQNLIVFMEDRIEVLVMQTTSFVLGSITDPTAAWSRETIHSSIGCSSKDSVVNLGEDIFFADQNGDIRSLARTIQDAGQGVKSLPVSHPIKTWIERINPRRKKRIVAIGYGRYYLLGLPIDDATEASHVFVFDTIRSQQLGRPVWDGPWTGGDGMKPYSLVTAVLDGSATDSDRNLTLFAGSSATLSGMVYRLFDGEDDDGDPIVYREVTKRYAVNTLDLTKSFQRLHLFAIGTGGVTMKVEANFDDDGFQLVGHTSLAGQGSELPLELPFDITGTNLVRKMFSLEDLATAATDVSFRLTCTAATEVKVLGFSLFGYMNNLDRTPA